MWRTDYFRIHENQYKKLKEEGKEGWADDIDIKDPLAFINETCQQEGITSGKLLDLGCGNGRFSIPFAEQGFDVYGIDISPTAIAWAKEKTKKRNLEIEYKVSNVTDLQYPDNFFNVVIDTLCLHCIIGDDRKIVLNQVYRVLKSGGIFIVITMCGDPKEKELIKDFEPTTRTVVRKGIAGRYIGLPEDILKEIESAGFKIINWQIKKDPQHQDELLAVAKKLK
ncbi:TPA: class I SAM-dependent methyltransferase [Candidatus Bathyarchaeota archaeon]|nr:class I SAM-dependent methyltransferase [Candidatus Bathyarchaeota archaeon]